MKNSRNPFILVLILLMTFSTPVMSQTWETLFTKVNKRFEKGQAYKVSKDLKKLQTKTIPKKMNNDTTLFVWIEVMKAYSGMISKDYRRMRASGYEALLQLERAKADSYKYQVGMLRMIDMYNEYGNYRLSDSLVSLLKNDFYYQETDLLSNELLIREAVTLKNNGFYKEADSVVQIVKQVWPRLYQKSYEGEIVTKEDIAYREDLMARVLTTELEIMSLEGKYEEALALHKERKREFNKLASSKTAGYQYDMVEIDLLNNYGDYKKANRRNQTLIAKKPGGLQMEKALLSQLNIMHSLNKGEDIKPSDIVKVGTTMDKHYKKSKANGEYMRYMHTYVETLVDMQTYQYVDAITKISTLRFFPTVTIPEDHPMREEVLRSGIDYLLEGDPTYQLQAEDYYVDLGKLIDITYHPNSITRNLHDIEMAGYYLTYSEKPTAAYALLESKPYEHVLKELNYKHYILPSVFDNIEEYLVIHAEFDYGVDLAKRIISALEENPNTDETHLGEQYEALAKMQIHAGQYKEAEFNTDKALKLIRKGGDKISEEYVYALNSAAVLYGTIGVYDKAEKLLNRSRFIARKLRNDQVLLRSIEDMAFLMTRIGEYSETEELLTRVIEGKEQYYGESSRQLIKPYRAMGEMHLIKGEYPEGEKRIRRAVELAERVYGENSLIYAQNLSVLVDLHLQLGNYESGLINAQKVLAVRQELLRPDHILFSKTYSQLGALYYYLGGEFNDVRSYFETARDIVEYNFDDTHPLYAEAIKNIAFLQVQYGKYDEALVLLNKADDIWADALGSKSRSSGEVARLKGDIYNYRQEFSDAKKEYEKSARYFRKIFSEEHPDFLNTRSKLARSYFIDEEYQRSEDIIDETTTAYLNYTSEYFPTLSEDEKSKFWAKIKPDFEFYNTLAIRNADSKPRFVENMYDYALTTKGLLLNSSIKTRQSIMNSGDTTLIQLFEKWTEQKEYLANVQGRAPEDLEGEDVNVNDIRDEIALLEKELGERSDAFSESFSKKPLGWDDVRKSLEDNEAAVEIIRFREFDNTFNEEKIRYAALVVTKETKKRPTLVYFENGNEMENRLFKAQRASIQYKVADKSSYSGFWQPIEAAIGDKEIVYVSPDGVYNQLNIESLHTQDGGYVIDDYNVRVINSTKNIVISRSRKAKKEEKRKLKDAEGLTALLFGNPDYYKQEEDKIFVDAGANRSINVDFVPQLPGTEKEVGMVSDLLSSNGWEIKSYVGDNATEQAIKEIEDATLIHIATHGFFDDNPSKPKNQFGLINEDNPLDRSGLVTYGGGDLLKKSKGNYNMEDGVLTAHEAMALNFDKTELIILSACETGRGEIQAGEGVFGLQRSFLVAGADAIVMSLFQVSDAVTQELMVEFYNNWLDGDPKRIAFNKAQKSIKERHPEPIYWGAFMMVSNQ